MSRDVATYRIADWSKHYETSETKRVKRLSWVPVPNAQGDGYLDLIEEHGAAGLGWWVALIQDASRVHRDRRDGTIRGTLKQIQRRTRIPSGDLPGIIRTLVQVGWLEELTESPGNVRAASGQHPGDGPLKTDRQTDKQEGRNGAVAPSPLDLMEVWNANRGELPKVVSMTGGRKRAAASALKDEPDLQVWDKVVRILSQRPFWIENRHGFDTMVRPSNRSAYLDLARTEDVPEPEEVETLDSLLAKGDARERRY